MLIVSKFKDFYDTAMGVDGIDKTLIYKRETTEIKEFKQDFILPSYTDNQTKQTIIYKPFIIGFCGKLYVTYRIQYCTKHVYVKNPTVLKTEYLHGTEGILKLMQKLSDKNTRGYAYDRKENKKSYDLVEKLNGKPYNKIFSKYNVPCFSYEVPSGFFRRYTETTLILNPRLKDFNFVEVMNPFIANQEISMFIGGVLGQSDRPMVEVSDKDRLVSKGFDKKWSFRNPDPPKRKQR